MKLFMLEEEKRLQNAVHDFLNDIDRKYLRSLEIQMHQCAIDCQKDSSNNIETLEKCTKICSEDVLAAHSYVENELVNWKHGIQRCVDDCRDNTVNGVPNSKNHSNESEINKYISHMESCASRCFTKYINLLPQLASKIVDDLTNEEL